MSDDLGLGAEQILAARMSAIRSKYIQKSGGRFLDLHSSWGSAPLLRRFVRGGDALDVCKSGDGSWLHSCRGESHLCFVDVCEVETVLA
jgi:hypothetical protein